LPRRIAGAFSDIRAGRPWIVQAHLGSFRARIGMPGGPAGQTDPRSHRWANGKLAFGRQTVVWGKLSDA
jgi:hypothetical protein